MRAAPETLATARLRMRAPREGDGAAIFAAYASDPVATRYMGWPRHAAVTASHAFVTLAIAEWTTHGCGTYLIERDGALIGSTGLHLLGPVGAATGYILTPTAWGHGYATEACRAMIALGRDLGIPRIEASCHTAHRASVRVLAKAGLVCEGVRHADTVFPQLGAQLQDVLVYAWSA
jgi:ribosomal-protein-alanine N-acetyltransferase